MTSVPEAPVPAKVVLTRVVLSQADIDRALTRIAHEILESNKGSQDLVLLGIPRRGYPLAVRLAAKIAAADPTVDPAAAYAATGAVWGRRRTAVTVLAVAPAREGALVEIEAVASVPGR